MKRELTTIRWDGNIPDIILFSELRPGDVFSLCEKDGTIYKGGTGRVWWTAESFPYQSYPGGELMIDIKEGR